MQTEDRRQVYKKWIFFVDKIFKKHVMKLEKPNLELTANKKYLQNKRRIFFRQDCSGLYLRHPRSFEAKCKTQKNKAAAETAEGSAAKTSRLPNPKARPMAKTRVEDNVSDS